MELFKNTIPIYYSSLTGNTKKLSQRIKKDMESQGYKVALINSARKEELMDAEICMIAFWCRRSSMDDFSMETLSKLRGRKILAIGTMGGNVKGDYGKRVINNVKHAIEEHNECIGVCPCKGALDLKRMKRRLQLPEDNPHHITEEKYQKAVASQGHPDEADLSYVSEYVMKHLEEY